MSSINFIDLNDLINDYIEKIDIIKDKHLSLLSELSVLSDLDTNLYLEHVKKISHIGTIIVCYIDNPFSENFDIIASGTIIIEPKLIRGGKSVGHIEDIVVKSTHRGKQISKDILDMLKTIAREKDYYKVILDCNEEIQRVYIKSGFEQKGLQMGIYF
jgi:ribosomal protein S18 acetylase RimI-like enzyme